MTIERNVDFDMMLDDCHDEVRIGNLTFSPSDILFKCDPVAYMIGAQEYEDSLFEGEDEEDDYDD